MAGCLGRGCLVLTAMVNLSHKLWVTAEQESVSLFYKYFGKVEDFLLMQHPEHFCRDATGLLSEVGAWGCIQLPCKEEGPWPDPADRERRETPAPSWGPVPVPSSQGGHRGLQGPTCGLRARDGERTKL